MTSSRRRSAGSGFGVVAHLHLSGTCRNASWVELRQVPPALPIEIVQARITEPLVPDASGDVRLPEGPGLGVELNTSWERVT